MATFKSCVQSQRKDGYSTVYIRVTHRRSVSYIKTDKLVDKKGISKSGEIKDTFVLKFCSEKIAGYIERLNKIDIEKWTVNEVISFLQKANEDVCFSDYARTYKFKMAKEGMARNARNYELAYQHLERYAGTDKLMFSAFTTKFIGDWIDSLKSTARAKEMYPVCIRQIFKAAILEFNDYDRDIIRIKTNPWLKVKIPSSDVPEKRAISVERIREFFTLPLPESKMAKPVPEMAIDVAKIVMCLAGINTVDLYFIEKSRYKDCVISYNRRKTMKFRKDKSLMEIRVPEIIKPLLDKYASDPNDEYLFNFHKLYSSYDSFNANVNGGLKTICDHNKVEHVCVYTFRHSWATIAQNDLHAKTEEVAFALNHASAHKVTEGYITKDYSPISKLNQKVIDYIFESKIIEETIPENCENNSVGFRFSFKNLMSGTAYFKGKKIYSFSDIGYNNVQEVINELAKHIPDDIPNRSTVLFKIENLDNEEVRLYERMKGKGF